MHDMQHLLSSLRYRGVRCLGSIVRKSFRLGKLPGQVENMYFLLLLIIGHVEYRMRAKSTALTTAVNWAFNAIVGKFSPIMLGTLQSIHQYILLLNQVLAATPLGTYIFFGCWCIVMSAFCYFFLPETKVTLH